MLFLKQSTACHIMFGPFLDKTDGVSLEVGAGIITSIDHATTGIFLSKNGAAGAIRHQTVTASVLDAYGMFQVHLDETDTGTVGTLRVMMAEAATFLPVWEDYMVLPANVYDALMGTDLLDVSVTQLLGTAWLTPAVAGTPDINVKTETDHDLTTTQKASVTAAVPTVSAIQSGLATPTNITAGTITTVTNLTNAPTAGDFTATMKTSLNAATPASIQGDTKQTGDAYAEAVLVHAHAQTIETDVAATHAHAAGAETQATAAASDASAAHVQADHIHDTDLPAVKTDTAAVKVQTDKLAFTIANQVNANVLSQANIDFGALQKASLNAATPASIVGAVGSVTGNVGGNVTGSVGSLNTQAKADVNAEVADVVKVDTIAEMSQGAPPAAPTILEILNYLYRRLRNKVTDDSSNIKVYNDGKDTVLFKAPVSDDGSTFTKDEYVSGA